MNIKKKFLKLTSKTYPHGTENELKNHLPIDYKEDGFGNFYIEIGFKPSTMFTCHLDTADRSQKKVKHIFEGNLIKTDGNSILGADDKAGMTVLLYMIENKIPGLYYFFIGEERGCIGSSRLSKKWKELSFSKYITKCISFDRRGLDSVITEQFYGVCCSDEFAIALSNELNRVEKSFQYQPDPTGIYTDSAQFTELIPECTNISVGYYSEHTASEKQDIKHLENLCNAVTKVDWSSLPIFRSPKVYDCSDFDETDVDSEFQSHNFALVNFDGKTTKMMISDEHIEVERKMIVSWMKVSGLTSGYVDFIWNGQDLHGATCSGEYQFIASRGELVDYIEELKQIPFDHLKNFS